MDLKAVLQRIEMRARDLGTTERQVALRAGLSADAIRNWRRRTSPGSTGGANMASLEKIAKVLDVSLLWLVDGAVTAAMTGLAEDATPFESPDIDAISDPVRLLYGASHQHPAITSRAVRDMPGMGIFEGDLIVCDLSRGPSPGEIAVSVIHNDDSGQGTIIRYFLPPFLADGDVLGRTRPIRVDDPGVFVRHPVIGIIRGVT